MALTAHAVTYGSLMCSLELFILYVGEKIKRQLELLHEHRQWFEAML